MHVHQHQTRKAGEEITRGKRITLHQEEGELVNIKSCGTAEGRDLRCQRD